MGNGAKFLNLQNRKKKKKLSVYGLASRGKRMLNKEPCSHEYFKEMLSYHISYREMFSAI